MRIVAVCGVGIGSSIILKKNAERALVELGLTATVDAISMAEVRRDSREANIILTTVDLAQLLDGIGPEIITIDHVIDKHEIKEKLAKALL